MSRTKVYMCTKCMCIFVFHYAKVWIQLVHISQQRMKRFIWIKLTPNMSTSSTRTRVISELLMSLATLISSRMVVLSRQAALLTLRIVRYVKIKTYNLVLLDKNNGSQDMCNWVQVLLNHRLFRLRSCVRFKELCHANLAYFRMLRCHKWKLEK